LHLLLIPEFILRMVIWSLLRWGNKYKISELSTDKSTYCVAIETTGSNMPEIGSDYDINMFVQGIHRSDLFLQIKDTTKNAKVE
jgi:hypothetical protein